MTGHGRANELVLTQGSRSKAQAVANRQQACVILSEAENAQQRQRKPIKSASVVWCIERV